MRENRREIPGEKNVLGLQWKEAPLFCVWFVFVWLSKNGSSKKGWRDRFERQAEGQMVKGARSVGYIRARGLLFGWCGWSVV